MDELTWTQILLALAGSSGLITLLLSLAKFVSERFDVRFGRKKEDADKAIHESAELKRLWSEELHSIVAERNAEIANLKQELAAVKDSHALSRPNVTKMYKALKDLEDRFKNLRATKCPDEVVDLINEKVSAALRAIGEMRDLLP